MVRKPQDEDCRDFLYLVGILQVWEIIFILDLKVMTVTVGVKCRGKMLLFGLRKMGEKRRYT